MSVRKMLVRALPRRAGAWLLLAQLFLVHPASAQVRPAAPDYFPPPGQWQQRDPTSVGMDAAALQDAVAFVRTQDNPAPRDQALAWAQSFGAREPAFGGIIGPMAPRGDPSGLIVRRGYVVAQWGDAARVDMAHSITKSFLSSIVGVLWQQGRIMDTEARVADAMPAGVDLFADEHNRSITWEHLLRQSSDWRGTLWGKPDWADRPEGAPEQWSQRPLHQPGAHFKYNDVRVNVLALAALHVAREPLPELLRRQIMNPIGASDTWRWAGYDNAWVEIDGKQMQSVSGGGHWGGGLFINTWDMARFGLLVLRGGQWQDKIVLSPSWLRRARRAGPANPDYGYANWFLNTAQKSIPAAPASAFTFRGNGQNVIYIDDANDLLIVVRWIKSDAALNEFIARVLATLH